MPAVASAACSGASPLTYALYFANASLYAASKRAAYSKSDAVGGWFPPRRKPPLGTSSRNAPGRWIESSSL